MIQGPKAISGIIQEIARLSLKEMLSSMKQIHGIGVLQNNYAFFFFFFLSLSWKMRSKQVKLTPSSMEQVQVKEYKARGAFEKYIMSQNR